MVACSLLGLEVVPNLLFTFSIWLGFGLYPSSPLYSILGHSIFGLVVGGALGALLGVVLLGQGGVSVP